MLFLSCGPTCTQQVRVTCLRFHYISHRAPNEKYVSSRPHVRGRGIGQAGGGGPDPTGDRHRQVQTRQSYPAQIQPDSPPAFTSSLPSLTLSRDRPRSAMRRMSIAPTYSHPLFFVRLAHSIKLVPGHRSISHTRRPVVPFRAGERPPVDWACHSLATGRAGAAM